MKKKPRKQKKTGQVRVRKKKVGRKPALTKEIQDKICELVRAGNYYNVACAYVGIGTSTFWRWMERGEEQDTGMYKEFRGAVEKAKAHSEAYAVAMVKSAMPSNWAAAMTYLERKSPKRWGRHERHEHTGADGGPIQVGMVTDESLLEKLKKLAGDGDEDDSKANGKANGKG